MRLGLPVICLALCCVLLLPAIAALPVGKDLSLWSGVAEASGCVTGQCHASLGKAKHVHAPVMQGDCSACHVATGQTHPGASSMRLTKAEPDLCLQCHKNPTAGLPFPHSAAVEGCTGCHSPHQGSLPQFLLQPGGKLCLSCHEDITQGKYTHGPVRAENCRICHAIHGGEHKAMLTLPGKDICFACHAGIKNLMEKAASQHEPVANGVCWDCHTPHASDYRPFLKEAYPEKFYTAFKEEKYALCFSCHDENAFLFERTSEATDFRNRDANLHYFHVNRSEKGRVCKGCHGVHGADQERLLVSKVPDFGKWDIPLVWASEGERATCYVGCHRPKTYDRMIKIKNY